MTTTKVATKRNTKRTGRLATGLLVGAGLVCGVLLSPWHAWATWPAGAVRSMPGMMCTNVPVGFVIPAGNTPAQLVAAENTERTFDCPFMSDPLHSATDVVSVTIDFYGATDANTANCPRVPGAGLAPLDQTGIYMLPCRQSWTGSAAACFQAPESWSPIVSNYTDELGPPSTLGQVSFAVPGFSYMNPAGSPYDYYYTEATIDACLSINLYGLRYDGTVDYEYHD